MRGHTLGSWRRGTATNEQGTRRQSSAASRAARQQPTSKNLESQPISTPSDDDPRPVTRLALARKGDKTAARMFLIRADAGAKSPRPWPPMSLDHGRFQSLDHPVGHGLYGDVWLYVDRLTETGDDVRDHRVSIKETHLLLARDALASHNGRLDNPHRERAVFEKIARRGGHRNVLDARHQFYQDGFWFLVTEWCSGGDLLSRLQGLPDRRMTEREALTCVAQITSGLHFLHQVVGVAHRDLSLENVLEHERTYKIADFGLAVSAAVHCRGCVGKAYYMAPEVFACGEDDTNPHVDRHVPVRPSGIPQADPRDDENEIVDDRNHHYDPKAADIWSLGIVLFILLTGSPLVPSASRQEPSFRALGQFGVERILEAWGLRDGLSVWTIELLAGMIQVDPINRLTTAQILVHPALTTLPPPIMVELDEEEMP